MINPFRLILNAAVIVWEGASLKVLRKFSKEIRKSVGFQLDLLQKGEIPKNFRSMKSIGVGVYETREHDKSHWYRVLYIYDGERI